MPRVRRVYNQQEAEINIDFPLYHIGTLPSNAKIAAYFLIFRMAVRFPQSFVCHSVSDCRLFPRTWITQEEKVENVKQE